MLPECLAEAGLLEKVLNNMPLAWCWLMMASSANTLQDDLELVAVVVQGNEPDVLRVLDGLLLLFGPGPIRVGESWRTAR